MSSTYEELKEHLKGDKKALQLLRKYKHKKDSQLIAKSIDMEQNLKHVNYLVNYTTMLQTKLFQIEKMDKPITNTVINVPTDFQKRYTDERKILQERIIANITDGVDVKETKPFYTAYISKAGEQTSNLIEKFKIIINEIAALNKIITDEYMSNPFL